MDLLLIQAQMHIVIQEVIELFFFPDLILIQLVVMINLPLVNSKLVF